MKRETIGREKKVNSTDFRKCNSEFSNYYFDQNPKNLKNRKTNSLAETAYIRNITGKSKILLLNCSASRDLAN